MTFAHFEAEAQERAKLEEDEDILAIIATNSFNNFFVFGMRFFPSSRNETQSSALYVENNKQLNIMGRPSICFRERKVQSCQVVLRCGSSALRSTNYQWRKVMLHELQAATTLDKRSHTKKKAVASNTNPLFLFTAFLSFLTRSPLDIKQIASQNKQGPGPRERDSFEGRSARLCNKDKKSAKNF